MIETVQTPPTWVTAAQEPYPLEGTRGDKIMYFEGLVQRHGMNAWVCAAIAQLVWPGCPSEAVRYFRQVCASPCWIDFGKASALTHIRLCNWQRTAALT